MRFPILLACALCVSLACADSAQLRLHLVGGDTLDVARLRYESGVFIVGLGDTVHTSQILAIDLLSPTKSPLDSDGLRRAVVDTYSSRGQGSYSFVEGRAGNGRGGNLFVNLSEHPGSFHVFDKDGPIYTLGAVSEAELDRLDSLSALDSWMRENRPALRGAGRVGFQPELVGQVFAIPCRDGRFALLRLLSVPTYERFSRKYPPTVFEWKLLPPLPAADHAQLDGSLQLARAIQAGDTTALARFAFPVRVRTRDTSDRSVWVSWWASREQLLEVMADFSAAGPIIVRDLDRLPPDTGLQLEWVDNQRRETVERMRLGGYLLRLQAGEDTHARLFFDAAGDIVIFEIYSGRE